jgi:predicted helicase
MIRQILEQYRQSSEHNRDLGDRFERLMVTFLKLDPQYQQVFEDVWLWRDWPRREQLGYQPTDMGIDIVAKLRDEDGFCAIQCKFYQSAIAMSDLGNFFTLSGRGGFTLRMIVATALLTSNAAQALQGQTIPVKLLTLEDLEASSIDWSRLSLDAPDRLHKRPLKRPMEHQKEALQAVLRGFEHRDRGKLIMACGTGKTYTSLIIAEQRVGRGGRVSFLVPSIALLSQSSRDWTRDASVPLRCFAVCSDSQAGRNEEDMHIHELAYPVTTDAAKLAHALKTRHDPQALTVVFSTYQSIEVVHQAHMQADFSFDLVICDEAHRTAGYTPPGEDHSAFVRVHDATYIRAAKRLYMTATPRIYAESSRSRAAESDVQVFSMDDEEVFGPEFHRLRFDEAVRRGLLSEYKVLVMAVNEEYVNHVLNRRIADQGEELTLDDAVKIIGCWNGLAKRFAEEDAVDLAVDKTPMRTAIAFAKSIEHSKLLAQEFQRIAEEMDGHIRNMPALEAQHVDGTMSVDERNKKLSWLKDNIGKDEESCRILTNARCLSEGIDVPALDAAIFLNPRDSVVDVVQSVGRVMRKDPAGRKKYGYVILPIGIRRGVSPEQALNDNEKYRVVWQVLNALRAHDDRLDKQFATIDLSGKANGVVNVIGVGGGSERADNLQAEQLSLAFNPAELAKWQEAIFAKIVTRCGNRRYWEQWAQDIATIAERHQMRIRALLNEPSSEGRKSFDEFLKGLRKNLNPSITEDEAIEMLAQHIITKPVFDALFEGYAFTTHNQVSQFMQKIMDLLETQALDKEHETLQGFYDSVRERVSGIQDPQARQRIIIELYDEFFKTAFPKMVERLGIVYTPVEVVDFILRSADVALRKHFNTRLADDDVHILDPFTGTGTFIVRLLESDLIPKERLAHKYKHELHANEIVLLAYYIAAINIEEAFHRVTQGNYEPFPGIVLTDTFQMTESEDFVDRRALPNNNARLEQQMQQSIRVIMGNPPYSAQQDSENDDDDNKNLAYPTLDRRIRDTYAKASSAKLVKNLYDSYIRAIRWACDRIGERGIVAYVTNGSFIDANNMDGLRKSLAQECSHLYVSNLRGNQRTSGEESKKEGGKIFGSGSRTPVAITVMVKDPAHQGPCELHYHDIGDYLDREQKLTILKRLGSIEALDHGVDLCDGHGLRQWLRLQPNEQGDWINQRDPLFETFVPLGNKDSDEAKTIFGIHSLGVVTGRDAWAYNLSRSALESNMRRMIKAYDTNRQRYLEACRDRPRDQRPSVEAVIDTDPKNISWTRAVKADLARNKAHTFVPDSVVQGLYRPFFRQWPYFNRHFNEMVYQQPKPFPTPRHENVVISVTGIGASKPFSALVTQFVPNLHLHDTGQCFPLYWYEKVERDSQHQGEMFSAEAPDQDGYVRRDAITDWALGHFRSHYGDDRIGEEDIFWYVYGILHSPEYRQRFAASLKKMLPRVPLAEDFWAFSQAGRKLGELHLNHETVEPWPVKVEMPQTPSNDPRHFYRVEKMRFASRGGREKDKTAIIYDGLIKVHDIPEKAYEYVVNGKSAIEWVMERYQVTTDRDSNITNDPNEWSREQDSPSYILDLLRRVIRVGMETLEIVERLPKLKWSEPGQSV